MADDEVVDDEATVEPTVGAGDDEAFDDDELDDELAVDDEALVEADDLDVEAAVLIEEGVDEEEEEEGEEEVAVAAKGRVADDDEDDDDEADPDDVEEDLDTILRDRIAAGADEAEDEDEAPVDDRSETGDRVAPRAAEEFSCPECFLLVRRSQFSAKRTDCPGGLDGADCPVKKQLSPA